MTGIPAGSFTMGSPLSENGRFDHEGPQHRVSIPRDFAAGVYHVTRAEYATFVQETGRSNDEGCSVWSEGEWHNDAARNWRNPGFQQTDLDPVVCVSWEDAQAYVLWLNHRVQGFTQAAGPSTKAGPYRLLTEAEWEYAARAGTTTPFYWGDENIHDNANAGVDRRPHRPLTKDSDRWEYTSPVGSFPANAFGLHDMLGNAWQWLEDCYHESYTGAPADGTPRTTGECKSRVARGGCWLDSSQFLRAANRGKNRGIRYSSLGFREIGRAHVRNPVTNA